MSEHKGRKVRFIYGIVFSALTLFVGALMIAQAWSIYRSAPKSPYTPANISAHFSEIAPVVWLWLLGLAANVALAYVFPEPEARPAAYAELGIALERLQRRLPDYGKGVRDARKQRYARLAVGAAFAALALASAAVCLWYLLDKTYTPALQAELFTGHDGAADRLVRCAPWIVAAFFAATVVTLLFASSKKYEIKLLKRAIADNAKRGEKAANLPKKATLWDKLCEKLPFLRSKRLLLGVRVGLCALGVALFVAGIANGGMTDVYDKAKNICTQCIGLG